MAGQQVQLEVVPAAFGPDRQQRPAPRRRAGGREQRRVAARVRDQAYVTEVAAEALAEEERTVEGQLGEAQEATGKGLPGLFAP